MKLRKIILESKISICKLLKLIYIFRKIGECFLTSNELRQYQQNTCLHRLHIICAHPASRSIGTWHIGHFLIVSFQPRASSQPGLPRATRSAPFSEQERPGCHVEEHREQNSLEQVGQFTATHYTNIHYYCVILKEL